MRVPRPWMRPRPSQVVEKIALRFPAYLKLKNLGRLLNREHKDVVKHLTYRHKKSFFSLLDGSWYRFLSLKDVIIPYSAAADYAERTGKGPVKFEDINQVHIRYQKELLRSRTGTEGGQVAILLGHYNHGKTTLLDSLSSTTLVSTEVDDITQEIRTIISRIPVVELDIGDDDSSSVFSKMVHETYKKSIQAVKVAPNLDQSNSRNGVENNRGVGVLIPQESSHREYVTMTLIDTPGQDVFYRMRNYAASIADLVILLVAADEEICLQTKESIGIVQGLNLPCIVCINKIDMLPADNFVNHLLSLEKKLREYKGLETAPIIPISAKCKVNLHLLAAAVQNIFKKMLPEGDVNINIHNKNNDNKQETKVNSFRKGGKGGQKPVPVDKCTAYGIVLNLWRSKKEGLIIHTVIRTGQVRIGDAFAAGGWSGTVRALFTMTPEISNLYDTNVLTLNDQKRLDAIIDSNHVNSINKLPPMETESTHNPSSKLMKRKKHDTNDTKALANTIDNKVLVTIPKATIKSVDAGIGVFISAKPDMVSDPRPLGEDILFTRGDRDGKMICETLVSQKEMEMRFPSHLETSDKTIREVTKLVARLKKVEVKEVELLLNNKESSQNNEFTDLSAEDIIEEIPRTRVVVKCHSDLDIGTIVDSLDDDDDDNDDDNDDSADYSHDRESKDGADDAAIKTIGMEIVYTGIGQVTKRDLEIAKHSKSSIFIYGVPNPQKDMLDFARANKVPIVRFRNILTLIKTLQGSGDVNDIRIEGSSNSNRHIDGDYVIKRIL